MRRRTIVAVFGFAALAGFAAARSPGAAAAQTTGDAATEADACGDFVRWTCGTRASRAANSAVASTLDENDLPRRNLAVIRQLLQRATVAEGADPALRALGNFYAACMDVGAVEAAGREPVLPLLTKAGSVRNRDTFFLFVGEFHAIGIEPVFRLRVEPDPDRSERYAAVLYPAELALPDPASYLDDGAVSRALRDAFVSHVRRLFESLGQPPNMAGSSADTVLRFETSLARARSASGGPSTAKKTRRVPRNELESVTPGLTWRWYLQGSETAAIPDFVVVDPDYFRAMAATVTELRIDGLQTYLRWQVLEHAAHLLPATFAAERAAFERNVGGDSTNALAREDRCAKETEIALRDLLAPPFVGQILPKETVQEAANLVGSVRESVLESISKVDWLIGASRSERRQRMSSMEILVGSPDPATPHAPPATSRDRYAYNTFVAFNERFRNNVSRVGAKVDRREWQVSPASSRIRYDAERNALSVPAGLLQPPYFSPAAGDASNYARLGAAVGAELIHAVDGHGATPPRPVAESYARELNCVEELGRSFTPTAGFAEDLFDLSAAVGGIRAAHRAWQRNRAGTGKPAKLDPAEEREFFTAFAEARCPQASGAVSPVSGPEGSGDSRKPGSRVRVLVPLASCEEFGRAFDCRPGSPARPKKACAIW